MGKCDKCGSWYLDLYPLGELFVCDACRRKACRRLDCRGGELIDAKGEPTGQNCPNCLPIEDVRADLTAAGIDTTDAVKRVLAAVAEAALKAAADKLLAAAMDYWKVFQKANPPGGAVVWVEDDDGRLVILTRGEYRTRLMANVDSLGTPTRAFDS